MRPFDLNVVWDVETKDQLPQTLLALQNLGYKSVALNHIVETRLPKAKCPFTKIDFPGRHPSFTQYSRLTIIMDNPQNNLGINPSNEIIRSYDLIAIQPENEKMFQVACTSLDIDIITLDMSSRLAFPIRPGYVKVAIERGIVFEVTYGSMIQDSSYRRHSIANGLAVTRYLKGGKNLIVSSGATAPWQIRAPVDVMNMVQLFGVKGHLKKATVTLNPHAAFMHASTRKHTFRGAVMQMPTEEELATDSTDMLDDFIKL